MNSAWIAENRMFLSFFVSPVEGGTGTGTYTYTDTYTDGVSFGETKS